MTNRRLVAPLALAGAALAFAGPVSAAPILDFTEAAPTTPLMGTFQGQDYELSTTDGSITNSQGQDGNTCPAILACERDGLGIEDDEISGGSTIDAGQTLTLEFTTGSVRLDGIHYLDLFTADEFSDDAPDDDLREVAQLSVNGGSFTPIQADSDEQPGDGNSGYLFYSLGGMSVDSLEFTAFPRVGENDNLGVNDHAVGAIQAVPLPSTLILFGLGLGIFSLSFANRSLGHNTR